MNETTGSKSKLIKKPGFNPKIKILEEKERKSDVSTFFRGTNRGAKEKFNIVAHFRKKVQNDPCHYMWNKLETQSIYLYCINPAFESWAEILLRHPSEED